LQSLALIWRTEGATALYKGFVPKLIRMGLGGGVSVATFEGICILAEHYIPTQ
jgi:solute carrier family 25 2-oxodicarboxylate transporter 21